MSHLAKTIAKTMIASILLAAAAGAAAEEPRGEISLAGGALTLPVPKTWKPVKPRFRIIEYEFSIEDPDGKAPPVRVTIMGAGGSVDANIERWKAQFKKIDKTRQTSDKMGKVQVHRVDIEGTFRERAGGPFSGAPEKLRPGYRMLGVIIATPGKGQYFIKAIGPAALLEKQTKNVDSMLKEMTFKE